MNASPMNRVEAMRKRLEPLLAQIEDVEARISSDITIEASDRRILVLALGTYYNEELRRLRTREWGEVIRAMTEQREPTRHQGEQRHG